MAAKTIPAVGEWLAADVPGIHKIAHITLGVSTQSPDVVCGDTALYPLFTLTEPAVLFHMWTEVEEAFTASVALTLGDSGDVDRYANAATIADTTAGTVFVADCGLTVPYILAADEVISVDMNGATAAAGLLHVYVEYAVLED
jgi:hypothetical protein